MTNSINNPTLHSFTLRAFNGEPDLSALIDLDIALKRTDDGHLKLETLDGARDWLSKAITESYNPYTDLILAEVDGQLVGKGNVRWHVSEKGE